MGETYTEEEVNQMLANQAISIRLDGLENAVKELTSKMVSHMEGEEELTEQLLVKIAEGANDRRKCEADLRRHISDNHESYHATFVKKTDLRVYAMIIITAVTMTTGFVTWMSTQSQAHAHNVSMDKLIKQIESIVEVKK